MSLVVFQPFYTGLFSKSYIAEIKRKKVILKVYNKNKAKSFNRNLGDKHQKILNLASKKKLIPNLVYSSENLTIQNFLKNKPINKKIFLQEKIFNKFEKTINKFHKIETKNILKLHNQIMGYKLILKNTGLTKKIINNSKNIGKYINLYKQDKLCHGDLHFKNIINYESKIFLLDLDYICISSKGFDIAMLAYQENISTKDIKNISEKLKISFNEVKHYKPICHLLDYLWQEVQFELKIIKKNNVEKKVIKNFLKNIS